MTSPRRLSAAVALPWVVVGAMATSTLTLASEPSDAPTMVRAQGKLVKLEGDETPWSSSFVNWSLGKSGIAGTDDAAAISWKDWGVRLERAAVGAVVLLETPYGHHVGFVVGRTKAGHLAVLGGNQANAVRYLAFRRSDVVTFRYPSGTPLPESYELPVVDIETLNAPQFQRRPAAAAAHASSRTGVARKPQKAALAKASGPRREPMRFVYEGAGTRQELVLTPLDEREVEFEARLEGACVRAESGRARTIDSAWLAAEIDEDEADGLAYGVKEYWFRRDAKCSLSLRIDQVGGRARVSGCGDACSFDYERLMRRVGPK